MSQGTRSIIGATIRAGQRAEADGAEVVRRFDAARTADELRAVLAYMKARDWFLVSGDTGRRMREAFERCRKRVNGN